MDKWTKKCAILGGIWGILSMVFGIIAMVVAMSEHPRSFISEMIMLVLMIIFAPSTVSFLVINVFEIGYYLPYLRGILVLVLPVIIGALFGIFIGKLYEKWRESKIGAGNGRLIDIKTEKNKFRKDIFIKFVSKMNTKPKIGLILLAIGIILFGCWFMLDIGKQIPEGKIQIKGTIEMPYTSWSPAFDRECVYPSPIIQYLDKTYYLDGVCPFQASYGGLTGKEVIIEGTIEERVMDVPLRKEPNPPTKKETFYVINVRNITLVK